MWDLALGLSSGKAGKPCCIPIAGTPGILTLWLPVIAEETEVEGTKGESDRDKTEEQDFPV